MDTATLLAQHDLTRGKLLASLDAIDRHDLDTRATLAWRPAPGRAHVAWQAMHCAASLDKILNVRLLGRAAKDPRLLEQFAAGSTPSDANVPSLDAIREALARTYADWRAFVVGAAASELARVVVAPNAPSRSVGDWIANMAWHEAHHQGQVHLTWNCFLATR